jgi:hypothetical protein
VSANFSGKKLYVDTIAAAFTDHFAVCLWVEVDVPQVRRGRGLWKLNRQLLDDSNIGRHFQQEWTLWRKEQRQNSDIVKWRSWRVKRNTRLCSTREGAQRKREDQMNEHFFYSCIYVISKNPKLPEKKTSKIKSLQGDDVTHLR